MSKETISAADRRSQQAAGIRERTSELRPTVRRLLEVLEPECTRLVAVLGFAILSVGLTAIGPKILGRATDLLLAGAVGAGLPSGDTREEVAADLRASGDPGTADLVSGIPYLVPGAGVDFDAIATVLLLVMGIFLLASVLSWGQAWVLTSSVNRAIYRLRRDVEDKLHRMPLDHVDAQPRGELLSRVTDDIDNVSQSLQQTLSQLLTSLFTVVATVVMMLYISPLLAMIALVTVPITMLVVGVVGRRSQRHFTQQWKSNGELQTVVEETYSGHELVKVFGRRDRARRAFAEKNDGLHDAVLNAQFISGLIMPLMMLIGNLNYVVVAVVGGLRVASGSMSLGDVQAFIQYSRQFSQPLAQVGSMANLMQSGLASAERVFAVLDAPEERPDGPRRQTGRQTGRQMGRQMGRHMGRQMGSVPRGRVEFADVSFSYLPEAPFIEHLDLIVEPGQSVALVGPTGSGKTTLVNLVMRFYELDGGRITLDDVDIADLRRDDLRSSIGMVLQDAWLFAGTIRDNIAYGRPDATEEEIVAAAEATYVDRFVRSLPDGYDTVLDDEGHNLSAGERQLVTIARAFLARPALLILDEATSSVDTRTEVLVQRAMSAVRSDCTSFVIAHRLSTIRDADLVVVMEDGRIVEQGTHDELLRRGGVFTALCAAQFRQALTPTG